MKEFEKYFRRPDLLLMRHLKPRSVEGYIKPGSMEYFIDSILMPLVRHIGDREVVVVHADTMRAMNTAVIVQESLMEQGITCGAPTSLPTGWQADSGKIQDLATIHLGAATNPDKLLLLIGHEHTLVAFCHHDEGCGVPGYGEIIGQDCFIAGHDDN